MEIIGQLDASAALTLAEEPQAATGLGGRARAGLHSVENRKIPASDRSR